MLDTVLHVAFRSGNNETVDEILKHAPELLVWDNSNGDTPLHVAAKAGHIATLKKLLQFILHTNGRRSLFAFLGHVNNQGNIMLHEAIISGIGAEIFQHLQEINHDNDDDDNESGTTRSHVFKRHWIHLEDEHGRGPLHYAALKGYHEGVVLLLGQCMKCCIKWDRYGCLPIHLASCGGHVEVVKLLLHSCFDSIEMLHIFGRNILQWKA
ncbi:hypothetical protein RJT34_11254 [Clitoria ternatea]|uniref:Uncharacterized protein n=1 Tax=Clitoria ternatea TaxID=43366 RepID=A0AAN9PIA4_CLITE